MELLERQAELIANESAFEAGALAYTPTAWVRASMPHKLADSNEFERNNGLLTLNMLAPSAIGLPYGPVPRLLMAWLTTEAVRTQKRLIELPTNMSTFVNLLGLPRTGGPTGGITRLRQQLIRLVATTFSIYTTNPMQAQRTSFTKVDILAQADCWWLADQPFDTPSGLPRSKVLLSENFFDQSLKHPVPIDLRALRALQRSPLAMDIYCWLTHRASYLDAPVIVKWELLALQFGSVYTELRDFKKAFLAALKNVMVVYTQIQIKPVAVGLMLLPFSPHIPYLV